MKLHSLEENETICVSNPCRIRLRSDGAELAPFREADLLPTPVQELLITAPHRSGNLLRHMGRDKESFPILSTVVLSVLVDLLLKLELLKPGIGKRLVPAFAKSFDAPGILCLVCCGQCCLVCSPIFPRDEILVLLALIGNQVILDIVPHLEDGIEPVPLPCLTLERKRQNEYVFAWRFSCHDAASFP